MDYSLIGKLQPDYGEMMQTSLTIRLPIPINPHNGVDVGLVPCRGAKGK